MCVYSVVTAENLLTISFFIVSLPIPFGVDSLLSVAFYGAFRRFYWACLRLGDSLIVLVVEILFGGLFPLLCFGRFGMRGFLEEFHVLLMTSYPI